MQMEIAHCGIKFPEVRFAEITKFNDIHLVPVYVIIGACYLLIIFITLLRLLLWKKEWSCARRFREADRKMIAYMLEGLMNMLHHREGIRMLESEIEATHMEHPADIEDEYKISGKGTHIQFMQWEDSSAEPCHKEMINTNEILRSKWAMTILSFYIGTVTTLALVVFWDVFIINEKYQCDDAFDCFYPNGTFIDQYCFCLSEIDFDSAKCYQLSLDFPKTIAEVAGILFLAFNGFAFLMFLKLLVADGIVSQCLRILAYTSLAVIEYIVVFAIIGAFVIRGEVLQTKDGLIEETLISIALTTGVTASWMMFLWAFKRTIRKKKLSKAVH